MKWVNSDASLLVYDTALDSKIQVYSAATGDCITQFKPDVIGLGIKSLKVSNGSQIIAAGLYDGSVALYNNLTAQEIASLQHIPKIDLNSRAGK